MALYHDVRPTSFEEVVGQNSQIQALKTLLDNGKLPHVIMFSGSSGTGKTSISRILASMLKSQDIREINASEQRGIDFVRDLIDDIRYSSPTPIVYILDEFDQVSTDGQKALKKVFEDYPPYVYFFLCTTMPNKIIKDIHTRSHICTFNPLTNDEICDIVRATAKKFEKRIPRQVVESIAENSEGSARKALVDLEKVMYLDEADQMLHALEVETEEMADTLALCRVLLNGTWKEISTCITNLTMSDWESVRYAVLGYMTSILLKNNVKKAAVVLEFFKEPWYNSGKAGLVYAAYMAAHMN
jgi:DNA polymerase III gamma/tau subunit